MAKGYKSGGRKKGTPNKLTKELREALKDVIFNELENIESNLEKLEPKDRVELLIKLMPFVIPKVEKISYSVGEPMEWNMI